LRYWWAKYREAATALWEKWRYLLDWPRSQSPILPSHHNFVAEGILKYAEADGHTPAIRYPSVEHGDEILADHVSELVDEVRSLLNRVYDRLGPYISYLEPWREIYRMYYRLRKPRRGDPIYATDYYYPMAIIHRLTQLFLSPMPEDYVILGEVARTRRAIVAREDYWESFKDYIQDYDVVVFDITASAASPSELIEILSNKMVKVMILCDTQAYHGARIQTFYDIFYVSTFIRETTCYWGFYLADCARQHFGKGSMSSLYDYVPTSGYKRSDVAAYGWVYSDPSFNIAFRHLGRGHIIEVPYDGCWKDAYTLERCLSFMPCSGTEDFMWATVFWFGGTGTDQLSWHQYPTVVDTLKALVGAGNVEVYA